MNVATTGTNGATTAPAVICAVTTTNSSDDTVIAMLLARLSTPSSNNNNNNNISNNNIANNITATIAAASPPVSPSHPSSSSPSPSPSPSPSSSSVSWVLPLVPSPSSGHALVSGPRPSSPLAITAYDDGHLIVWRLDFSAKLAVPVLDLSTGEMGERFDGTKTRFEGSQILAAQLAREEKERQERLEQEALEAKQRQLAEEKEAAAMKERQLLQQIKQRLQQQSAGSLSGLGNASHKSFQSNNSSGVDSDSVYAINNNTNNSFLGRMMRKSRQSINASSSFLMGSGKSFVATTKTAAAVAAAAAAVTAIGVATEAATGLSPSKTGNKSSVSVSSLLSCPSKLFVMTEVSPHGDEDDVDNGDYYIPAEQWNDDIDGGDDAVQDKKVTHRRHRPRPTDRPGVHRDATVPTITAVPCPPPTSDDDVPVVRYVRAAAVAGPSKASAPRQGLGPFNGSSASLRSPDQHPSIPHVLQMQPPPPTDSAARAVASHLASRDTKARAVRPSAPLPSRHLKAHGQGLGLAARGLGQGLAAISIKPITNNIPATPDDGRDGEDGKSGSTKVTSAVYLSSLHVLIGRLAHSHDQSTP